MARISLLKLTAVCLTSSTVPAAVALTAPLDVTRSIGLLPRAPDSCGVSNYLHCNLTGFPSTFCCPAGSACIPFNNAASVVCCPAGQDCKTIKPITCDISQQNATLHPSNQLHTTDLKGTLQACGNLCCPKGFTCQNGQCVMNAAAATSSSIAKVSNTPTASSSTTSPTNKTIPSSSASSTSGSTASLQSSVPTATAKGAQCEKFPALAIIVGLLPGFLLGVIVSVLVFFCIGRRRRRSTSTSTTTMVGSHKGSEFGSHAATVSEPVFQPGSNAFRTDFLRHDPTPKPPSTRSRSIFSRSSSYRSRDGIGRSLKSPVRTPDMRREPSMESIKIYSPPNGGLGRPATTFTDMMADAGFRPGDPYMH